ncbi:MAG: flavin reductase family protein [Firmicutes bacterium]|nr:flavin reductase family protein [Bacillota bacterium]
MKKIPLKGMLCLYPLPVVLVTSLRNGEPPNIATLAWTGEVCSNPEMIAISVQPVRHTFKIIRETGEFGINMPTAAMVRQVDICGVNTGKDANKFNMCGFTQFKSERISAPLIAECPVNLECLVKHTLMLGSHYIFIAQVLTKHITKDLAYEDGNPMLDKLNPLSFVSPNYYKLEPDSIGHFGFSKNP